MKSANYPLLKRMRTYKKGRKKNHLKITQLL